MVRELGHTTTTGQESPFSHNTLGRRINLTAHRKLPSPADA